jgi:hypothetical protein
MLKFLGEVCGSVILDGLFEDYLIKALGAKTYKGMSDATKRVAMQRWQNDIKPHYAGLEDEDGDLDLGYIIPIPGMPNGILYMEKYVQLQHSVDLGLLTRFKRARQSNF